MATFKKNIIYVKGKVSEGEETKKENLSSTGSLSKGLQWPVLGQAQTRNWKRHSGLAFDVGDKIPTTWATLGAFPGELAGSWVQSRAAGAWTGALKCHSQYFNPLCHKQPQAWVVLGYEDLRTWWWRSSAQKTLSHLSFCLFSVDCSPVSCCGACTSSLFCSLWHLPSLLPTVYLAVLLFSIAISRLIFQFTNYSFVFQALHSFVCNILEAFEYLISMTRFSFQSLLFFFPKCHFWKVAFYCNSISCFYSFTTLIPFDDFSITSDSFDLTPSVCCSLACMIDYFLVWTLVLQGYMNLYACVFGKHFFLLT